MKKYYFFLICLFTLFISCDNQQVKILDIESEKASIQKVIDEHLDAIDSLDIERILAVQTDDHLDMPQNVNRLIGKQAYKDYFTPFFEFFASLKSKEMKFNPTEFVVSGEWAFQIGTYSTKFVMPDDSELKDEGNYVWIFKKESDGKWKWARVISNSTLPANN